jgi:hypothetical protein
VAEIAVRTLGELVAHNMGLTAYCNACGHRRHLNIDDLIKRLGADFDFIGKTLDPRLRCTECDEKKADVQVTVLNANRSRFAD